LSEIAMDKQKKEQLILLIAVVILVIILPRFLFRKKEVTLAVPTAFDMQQNVIGNVREVPDPVVEPVVIGTQPVINDNKDPFAVPVGFIEKMKSGKMFIDSEDDSWEDPNSPKINLQGIVWGSDQPMAFIDDKVYRKGDAVGDAQILDIDKKGVYLLNNGERVLVRMKKQT